MFHDLAKKLVRSLICGKTASWPSDIESESFEEHQVQPELHWAFNQPSQAWPSNFQDHSQISNILSAHISNSSLKTIFVSDIFDNMDKTWVDLKCPKESGMGV